MYKKVFFVFSFVILFSLVFVSAGSFSDFFKKITGRATTSSTGTINVAVADASSSAIITNAQVTLYNNERTYSGTFNNNVYTFSNIATGTYTLVATASGYYGYSHTNTVTVNQGTNNGEVIMMTKSATSASQTGYGSTASTATVNVYVYDGAAKSSISGASAKLVSGSGTVYTANYDSATSAYVFSVPGGQSYTSSISATGYNNGAPVSLTPVSTTTTSFSVSLTKSSSITQTGYGSTTSTGNIDIIVSDKSSLSIITNAQVILYNNERTYNGTFNNNVYTFSNIATGTYTLVATASGYNGYTLNTEVIVNQGNNYGEAIMMTKLSTSTTSTSSDFCYDSDNGYEIFRKGNVSDFRGQTYLDGCAIGPANLNFWGFNQSSRIFLAESYCFKNETTGQTLASYNIVNCSNGCYDGACIKENSSNVSSTKCSDSDGDNIYKKGTVIELPTNKQYNDTCTGREFGSNYNISGPFVVEYYCAGPSNFGSGGFANTISTECKYGCHDGACIKEPIVNTSVSQVCSGLIEKRGILSERYGDFVLKEKEEDFGDFYWQNLTYKSYGSLYQNEKDENSRLEIVTLVFDNSKINLDEVFFSHLRDAREPYEIGHFYIDDKALSYYYFGREGEGYSYKSYMWYQDNVLVLIQFSNYPDSATDPKIEKIEDFILNLRDNQFKSSVPAEDYNNGVYDVLHQLMQSCSSEVNVICAPRWEEKIEPAVCPEYGFQNYILRDSNRCVRNSVIQEKRYCSPGICSGCYVPRWMGYDNGDNVCVPYGTRLEFQNRDKETLEEKQTNEGDYNLKITSENEATLEIRGQSKKNTTSRFYTLRENQEISIENVEYEGDNIQFRVDEIIMTKGDRKGYVEISILRGYNGYCNYDGNIFQQKNAVKGEEWARCQNNYECESNLCSSGECIELQAVTQEVKGFQAFFVKLICRFTNLFSQDGFEKCVAEGTGQTTSTPTSSTK